MDVATSLGHSGARVLQAEGMGQKLRLFVLVACWAAVAGTLVRSGRLYALNLAVPSVLSGVTGAMIDRFTEPLRDRLLAVAAKFGEQTYVPYVWGGNAMGDPKSCSECRACMASKKRVRVERRARGCAACRQCGMDCSHFVTRVYNDAGIKMPYASTNTLNHMSKQDLRDRFGLVDIGRQLSTAKPGDLLLHDRHITLLLKLRSDSYGDVLHASRSNKKGRIGGVEVAVDKNLLRFRGRLRKILRPLELDREDRDLGPFVRPGQQLAFAPRGSSFP